MVVCFYDTDPVLNTSSHVQNIQWQPSALTKSCTIIGVFLATPNTYLHNFTCKSSMSFLKLINARFPVHMTKLRQ